MQKEVVCLDARLIRIICRRFPVARNHDVVPRHVIHIGDDENNNPASPC
jgi:hypothetical protein